MKPLFSALLCALLFSACHSDPATKTASGSAGDSSLVRPDTRIVSLNGALSEILAQFGYEKNIVGADVTSTYPASVAAKPRVGHNRSFSAEAIIALRPTLVLGLEAQLDPGLAGQLRSAGARVIVLRQEPSLDGAKALIKAVADSLRYGGDVSALTSAIDADRNKAVALPVPPKVLFIYARGPGTLMASGTNTSVDRMIGLAGARNAVTGYEDFKPLTAEALITANPDVILLFSSGLESLGGLSGLMDIPGVKQTAAGKAGRVVEMDGQLLTGFGPRTGEAVATLSQKLYEAVGH